MSMVSFADVVHQTVSFDASKPADDLVLQLIDTSWVQRLRDISQTANTKLVYMFAEHSRFGHSVGVAYLAKLLLDKLARQKPAEVAQFRTAIQAAALLHDVGHLAPGSHTAWTTWFPNLPDEHESVGARIINTSDEIQSILTSFDPALPQRISDILMESPSIPAWTWEIISGGAWNVDRGNWCIVDSVLAGVSYGKYNVEALLDSFTITDDGHLALAENRLDAMVHFALSRHAMYRQVYQHRVILATDALTRGIAHRARVLGASACNADEVMSHVLHATTVSDLSLEDIAMMREPWWRYHVLHWQQHADPILSDLSKRLIGRKLFKTIRVRQPSEQNELNELVHKILEQQKLDPDYYLWSVSTSDMLSSEASNSMMVVLDDGSKKPLVEADPIFQSLFRGENAIPKHWLVVPESVKAALRTQR